MTGKWWIFKGMIACWLLLTPAALRAECDSLPSAVCYASECDSLLSAALFTCECDGLPIAAVRVGSDSQPTEVHKERRLRDPRVHRGYTSWERMLPTQAKVQYAGSIGIVAAGFGWDYGRRGEWETDFLFGLVPPYNSAKTKFTITLKESYVPWCIPCSRRISFEPFVCGLFLSSVVSESFWVKEPDRYPDGYYTFSIRIRSHIFMGQRFSCAINTHRADRKLKGISIYYELSTCDLYLISRLSNKTMKTKDILSLSFGLKFQLL